jgi:hypothetical protein
MENSVKAIRTQKIGAGHFEVNIYGKNEFIGSFKTNESWLVDDISEFENGFEKDMTSFENFEELINYCLGKLN